MAGGGDRRFAPGETLFREGEPSDEVFLIRTGEVEILKEIDGGRVVLGSLGAGEFVGEMGVLQQRARSATVQAAAAGATAEAIPKDVFLRRISRESDTAFQLLVRLSERLRQADLQLARSAGSGAADPSSASMTLTASVEQAGATGTLRVFPGSPALEDAIPADGLPIDAFPFVIGRRLGGDEPPPPFTVDLDLPDRRPYRLSRAHLAIRRHDGGFIVSDLGSVLGTAVNGSFLGQHFPIDTTDLHEGDNEIVAGGTGSPFVFHLRVEP